MNLSQAYDPGANRRGRFVYRPSNADALPFVVELSYLSPALYDDTVQKEKVKHVGRRRSQAPEMSVENLRELQELLNRQILLPAVHTIRSAEIGADGHFKPATWRHVAKLVLVRPEAVQQAGGWDAAVNLDATAADDKLREEAKQNILFLLNRCDDFNQWVTDVVRDISQFQDEDWETQLKNSVTGPDSSSGPAPSPSEVPADAA